MPFPRIAVASLLLGVLIATVAAAGVPDPEIEPAPPTPAQRVYPKGFVTNGGTCQTGAYLPTYPFLTNYLAPPEDLVTLLKPSDCFLCQPGVDTLRATAAHVLLNFVVPCAMPVRVSIVGAYDSSGCMLPDTNQVLCPGVTLLLSSGTTGLRDFTVPLPDSCKWQGAAYLMVSFLGTSAPCDTSTRMPRIPLTPSCTTCEGWDYFLGARVETCSIEELNGRLGMYVDVASCVVPTQRRSWGQLKIRYR